MEVDVLLNILRDLRTLKFTWALTATRNHLFCPVPFDYTVGKSRLFESRDGKYLCARDDIYECTRDC